MKKKSQFFQLSDKKGNVYYPQLPYKSRSTALLFDPFLLATTKSSYGGQLKNHSGNWAFDKAQIGYEARQQNHQIFRNVGNYIVQFKDDGNRLNLFKNALQTRINDARLNVSEYNLEQIAEFFPWVMSCQLLFQPLRSYMYCIKNNIPSTSANEVVSTLPSEMINNEVNIGIYNAVYQNNSLIQQAKQIYSLNNVGYLIKGFRLALLGSKMFADFITYVKEKLTGAAKAAYDTIVANKYGRMIVGGIRSYFTGNKTRNANLSQIYAEQQPDKDDHEKAGALKFFDELANQIFQELRIYGEIVVNVNYLRISALRKIMDGKAFFYYLDKPNLLFTVENSFLTIYRQNQNMVITPIPPAQFTLAYLRKMVQTQVVALGGRMFKSIKDQITLTQQDKQGFNRFSKKFLSWKTNIPSISKKELKQLNEKTVIKKRKLNQEEAQKVRMTYAQDDYVKSVNNIYINDKMLEPYVSGAANRAQNKLNRGKKDTKLTVNPSNPLAPKIAQSNFAITPPPPPVHRQSTTGFVPINQPIIGNPTTQQAPQVFQDMPDDKEMDLLQWADHFQMRQRQQMEEARRSQMESTGRRQIGEGNETQYWSIPDDQFDQAPIRPRVPSVSRTVAPKALKDRDLVQF